MLIGLQSAKVEKRKDIFLKNVFSRVLGWISDFKYKISDLRFLPITTSSSATKIATAKIAATPATAITSRIAAKTTIST
jgi:hypothetical protein